ncbi:MAG: tetratricopeptide repeat protein [Proteobacteria bacterium]|nr:tetratricopeptide repeat protein [Pseudomonadota bacterium]
MVKVPEEDAIDDAEPVRRRPYRRPFVVTSLDDLRSMFWNTFAILALAVSVPLAYALVTRDTLVIEEISTPTSLEEKGYFGKVVAQRIFDEMRSISQYTMSEVKRLEVSSSPLENQLPPIELPLGQLDLQTVIRQARLWLGLPDKTITGEIIVHSRKVGTGEEAEEQLSYSMALRSARDGLIHRSSREYPDMESLTRATAVALVERFDPLFAGYYHFMRRNYTEAKRIVETMEAQAPRTKPADAPLGPDTAAANRLHLRGLIERGQNNWREAADWFGKAHAVNPDNLVIASDYTGALRRFDPKRAEELAHGLVERFPKAWNGYMNLAFARAQQRRNGDALALVKQAMELAPDSPGMLYQASLIQRGSGRMEDAAASLERTLALDATAFHAARELVRVYRDLEQWPRARVAAETMIRIDPTHALAHIHLARVLIETKDLAGAEAAMKVALQLDPKSAVVLAEQGRLLLIKNNLTRARKVLEEAVALENRLPEAQEYLGDALVRAGKRTEAIAAYRNAIDSTIFARWRAADAQAKLGELLEKEKDAAGAAAAYRAARNMNAYRYKVLEQKIAALEAGAGMDQRALTERAKPSTAPTMRPSTPANP